MRFLTISFLSFLLFTCGSPTSTDAPVTATSATDNPATAEEMVREETEAPMTSRGMESTEVEEPEDASPMGAIRQDYARIEAALKAGTLRKDSVSYDCGYGIGGQVFLYSDDDEVVMVVNESCLGDHAGTTDHYYLRDGAPVFLFKETGEWQFGGEMRIMEDGTEVPGTIDKLTEDRMYFHNGKTIKALTKTYEIRNGEDIDPNTIPNKAMEHNGEIPKSFAIVQSVIATRKVDCALVD